MDENKIKKENQKGKIKMYQIKCMNPISAVGTDLLNHNYEVIEDVEQADAILVRSASLHDIEFPKSLRAIARAGAGVNNIPLDECAEKGIVVFNTPGANANAVKEIVIAGLLMASRDLLGGNQWVKENADRETLTKDMEKEKKRFAGNEILGKKIGVIGLGAIGILVANMCDRMGMEVFGYDPYVSVDAAWNLSKRVHHTIQINEIYEQCDYITLHVPLLDGTKEMINEEAVAKMKEDICILNFSRDALVSEQAIKAGLESGRIKHYITDFPTNGLAGQKGVIAFPHLGASTEEAEDNCAKMAVKELKNYLENGNIKNSVNYPNCDMGVCQEGFRITILHKNIPSMLSQFTSLLAEENVNIEDMINKSKKKWAYTMLDTNTQLSKDVIEHLKQIDGVVRVRVIH